MRVNTKQALAAGAMETFTKLLDHASDVIRAKAARDIMDLRYPVLLTHTTNKENFC